jgi:hypothetical protein
MAAPLPIIGSLVMTRALDPYHRIRATVGAIFVLSVVTMAIATMHSPVRRPTPSQGGAVTATAPAGTSGGLVAPVAPVGSAAPAARPRASGAGSGHTRLGG